MKKRERERGREQRGHKNNKQERELKVNVARIMKDKAFLVWRDKGGRNEERAKAGGKKKEKRKKEGRINRKTETSWKYFEITVNLLTFRNRVEVRVSA